MKATMSPLRLSEMILLPQPRRLTPGEGGYLLPLEALIVLEGSAVRLFPLARLLQQSLEASQRLKWSLWAGSSRLEVGITLRLDEALLLPSQGYQLRMTPQGIWLQASQEIGLFYGVMTLRQLLRQVKGVLPCGEIDDAPDYSTRGLMLDISRDKVPTLATLFQLVERLAEWKINHLELYTEHTFAYPGHRAVWAQSSPLTGEEILALEAHCRAHFIELVPNQNSFGHMHRWLEWPAYHDLAECPDGFDWPWGSRSERPFSFHPGDPRLWNLLDELYSDLLPHFTSHKFNVGCDETFDLGQGKSHEACQERGKGRVYLEFLQKVSRLVQKHGRKMHFWGDILLQHPELIPELPQEITALVWGYEADHAFDEQGAKFAAAGVPFYVCPGTSSWCSIAGRTQNALDNLRNAALNGLKHGASGLLNTDWGDFGHWQTFPISFLGWVAGAGLSWNLSAHRTSDFIAELNTHVFQDENAVMGKLVHDLGNAYLHLGHQSANSTVFFHLLYRKAERALHENVTVTALETTEAYVEEVMQALPLARMKLAEGACIQAELQQTSRMLRHACHRGLALRQQNFSDPAIRLRLAEEMNEILGHFRELWVARHRIGGLAQSTLVLEERLREYLQEHSKGERAF